MMATAQACLAWGQLLPDFLMLFRVLCNRCSKLWHSIALNGQSDYSHVSPIAETYAPPLTPSVGAPGCIVSLLLFSLALDEFLCRYFKLRLTRSGIPLDTDPIPFNAVALGSDEEPAGTTEDSLVTCESESDDEESTCPQARLENSGSMQMKVCLSQGLRERLHDLPVQDKRKLKVHERRITLKGAILCILCLNPILHASGPMNTEICTATW